MKSGVLVFLIFISSTLSADVVDITGWARCSDTTRFLKKLQQFRALMSPSTPNGLTINYRPGVNIATYPNGTKYVTCAKGQLECDLSKYQVCAKKYVKVDPLVTITCMQGTSLAVAEGCVKKTLKEGRVDAIAAQVKKCATSTESVEILFKENAYKPGGITWLPWITINDTRVAGVEGNPKKYLCELKSMKGNKACV